jgi:hypothetical protein
MMMPRSVEDILAHADELARKFEEWEPDADDIRPAGPYRALTEAVLARARAEQSVAAAVEVCRSAGYTWLAIGQILGTSASAAQQRYGHPAHA